jgi:hypothetical protein
MNFNGDKPLESPDEVAAEINNVNSKQAQAFKLITQLTGLPEAITGTNFINVSKYYKNYYETNPEGRLVKKKFNGAINPAAEVTPELEESFNLFNNANAYRSGLQNMWSNIAEDVNIKDFRPDVIQNARNKAENSPELTRLWNQWVSANKFDRSFNPVAERKKFLIDHKDDISKEMEILLANEPEGKVYKAFENLKNKLSSIEVTTLKDDKELEQSLVPALLSNRSNVRDITTNENIWSAEGGGDKFLADVPKDENGNINYDAISTGFGLDPENGLIGVISFNGKFYEFDIDGTNYDQFITKGSKETKTKIRFYDELYKSMKNSSNTSGKFTIGNIEFNIKTKAKNLGTDSPEFTYIYNFGEGEHTATQLGEIYAAAARISNDNMNKADANLQLEYIKLQNWRENEFNKITTWQQRENLDAEFNRRIKEVTEKWQKENSKPIVVGKDVGKGKPQVKGPFNLGQ